MVFRKIDWLWVVFILLLYLVGAVFLAFFLSPVTPREELKEVCGLVSACDMVKVERLGTGYNYRVDAQLAGYDHGLVFYDIEGKLHAVYSGLQVGADVVLLVDERERGKTIIWEAQSNGTVFLHYEIVAQWHKSNKQWGFGLGLALLLIANGIAIWRIVMAIKKNMV